MNGLIREDLPGTPLSDAQVRRREIITFEQGPQARYAWDTGVAIGRFLEGLREGRLLARRCHRCARVLLPPRMFCERCFRPTDAWVQVPDTGTVNTYSVSHIRWDASPLEEPVVIAVIRIDGTSDGGFLHYLDGVDGADVRIGMRLQAVWKPAAEREGSILDIRHFRRA
ncbi:MAG TPA: Zn-ribbon domain-containing OB-fold protein [Dehalococcoidia bacterium]|nr:Zn-ribbon domain-containing OB-fold protein [Dehalococcoidia bacterium]